MSFTNALEGAFLRLVFRNEAVTPVSVIGGTGLVASASPGVFYLAMHTASPTDSGSYADEVSVVGYAAYVRVGLKRTPAGWTYLASSNKVANGLSPFFAMVSSDAGQTATFLSIGTELSAGTGMIAYIDLDVNIELNPDALGPGSPGNFQPTVPFGALDFILD